VPCGLAKRKNPAWDQVGSKPGERILIQWGANVDCRLAKSVAGSFGGCDALPTQCFALFATSKFAWFFIAFLKLQAFEKAIVLNFLLQNPHGFFKVVVDNLNFNCLQAFTPPSFHLRIVWNLAELSRTVVILNLKDVLYLIPPALARGNAHITTVIRTAFSPAADTDGSDLIIVLTRYQVLIVI
jgi:hypothetical protein